MRLSPVKWWRFLALAAMLMLIVTAPARADDDEDGDGHGRIPVPVEVEAKGDKCVLPTPEMRRNHMQHILHQRDETMHQGIRTKQFSLKECINCHVQPKADGSYPAITSSDHFCNSCHSYAAVKIDCFECHATHPGAEDAVPTTAGEVQSQSALQGMAGARAAGGIGQ